MQEILKKVYKKHKLERYLQFILGLLIIAIGFNLFILPNDIVFGGVSGVSIIVSKYFDINPSLFILVSSLILLLVSYLFLGEKQTRASILGSLLFPLFVSLTSFISDVISLPVDDQLVMALFGGIFYGFGTGLVFKAGFTTGGTDILNQIVSKYFKISMGNSMLIVDGFIVLVGAFVFGPIKFMYSIIVLYIISILTDKVLLGISSSKAFYIITDEKEKICDYVINELNHSITTIGARGVAKNKKHDILFAVIPTSEYFKLKNGIKEIDKDAFFTVVDAYEVMGGE